MDEERKNNKWKPSPHHPDNKRLLYLSLLAIGIGYGDIGTSPLYAIRECFNGPHSIATTHENIFGILSLVFWSLILVILILGQGALLLENPEMASNPFYLMAPILSK